MGPDTTLLLQAVDAVQDAPDLDGVVTSLARVLRSRFDLWHLSACSLGTGSPNVTILASWTIAESVLTAGTEVAATITPAAAMLLAQVGDGRPVHTKIGANSESIIDYLMFEQGVRQASLQTVHRDELGMVFLVFGSGRDDLLPATPAAFFAGLAAGIRPRVLELTHLSST
ncbi:MAG: hypothetical protein ABR549_05125 [Mycobacteriales bacterium]